MLVVLNRHKSSKGLSHNPAQEPSASAQAFLNQGLYLETCLRRTVLLSEAQFEAFQMDCPDLTKGFDVHQGYEAIEYLVKVLSGLESPIVGETEVLGQFKKQMLPQLKEKTELAGIVQFVLNLVKLVRTKHLVGLGSQSYGSMVRRILKGEQHVLFVGAGVLAESILPWVKASKNIMISVRSLKRFQNSDVHKENKEIKAFSLDENFHFDFPLNVVVCAPISADSLERYLASSNVNTVIDLREESKADPIKNLRCKIFNLEKVFKEVHSGAKVKENLIKNIEDDISHKIEERFVKYRPFGWDDLCL